MEKQSTIHESFFSQRKKIPQSIPADKRCVERLQAGQNIHTGADGLTGK
jgi:hypothetical protein